MHATSRNRSIAMAVVTLVVALGSSACAPDPESGRGIVRVGAASSLRNVLPRIATDFSSSSGPSIEISFGASGTIATQAIAGAPMDAVVVAGRDPIRRLREAGRLEPGSAIRVAGNSLVLILGPDEPVSAASYGMDLLSELPANRPVAVADPRTAPLGAYTRALLRAGGHHELLRDRLVFAPHAAAVVAWVNRGEAGAGIVYRTDAAATPGLAALALDTGDLEIEVVAARLAGSPPGAADWTRWLLGDSARHRWTEAGFR